MESEENQKAAIKYVFCFNSVHLPPWLTLRLSFSFNAWFNETVVFFRSFV